MTIPNLTKRTDAAMSLTEEVTTRWNDRLVGSEACLACGDFLEKEIGSFCDTIETQEFSVKPGSFLGYIRINIVLFLLALVALYFRQIGLATGLTSLSLLITILQFFFYREFIDFLYPKKRGKNVFGRIEPSGEVKQQIIVSAHHDSAHIFNFLEKDAKSYSRKILNGFSTLIFAVLFTWILFIAQLVGYHNDVLFWSFIGFLTFGTIRLYPLWFFFDKKGTPGAGDNMVCTALAIEIGKYFAEQKEAGNGLKHTRVMIASWDAEECGLRGARAFTKMYEADLQATKTYNFNLECMYDHEQMSFLTSDLNGFVALSEHMAEECAQVGEGLGYPIELHKFPFLAGGTDAAEFAKRGIEATTLAAMNWTTRGDEPAYHTTRDTIDAVDREAVERSIAIGIHYVLKKEMEVK